jgi:hypothetical protein
MDSTIAELPVVAFLYKLVVGEGWYVGSSIESIQARMSRHYRQGLATPDRKLYKAVADGGGWKNVRVEILTTLPFTSKEDLWREEDKHINTADPNCLNSFRAILTEEERKEQKNDVKRRCWKRWTEDPEFKERERERQRGLYERQKSDPEFLERKRKTALASYHRRKGQKTFVENQHSNDVGGYRKTRSV